MTDSNDLERLLSLVEYREDLNTVEGIDVFRSLLAGESSALVLPFLTRNLSVLQGQRRAGVAFVIAEHYFKSGDLSGVRNLFGTGDSYVRSSVLNALWGEPNDTSAMGPALMQLLIGAADDLSPAVRTEVCSVLQNQCAWGVDVTTAIPTLLALLKDRNDEVRSRAACAVGNLAKGKYYLSQFIGQLRRNAKRDNVYARSYAAWALWQLSRYKHEIGSSVPELVGILELDEEWNEPRKHAAGALLHHAKKAPENATTVSSALSVATLDLGKKEVCKLLSQLANLVSD